MRVRKRQKGVQFLPDPFVFNRRSLHLNFRPYSLGNARL
jgi:hypothetical protein